MVGVRPASQTKAGLWSGRTITGLIALFLAFDGLMKVIREPHVLAASAELGYSPDTLVVVGALLLACTLLYVVPRTAVLGAILLTGYLGGAVASNVRVHHPVFQCIFPVIIAGLAWAGIYLQNARLPDYVSPANAA